MKILIVGYFTELSKDRIRACFPPKWDIQIVEPGEAEENIYDAHILIPEHIQVDDALLKKAEKLLMVQTGAGYDNVDINACNRHGIRVANAAGVNAVAVAEHTIALLMSYYKNIAYLDRFMKEGQDEKQLFYEGAELEGMTIGIIGLGAIGKRVAAFSHALGMKVLGYDIYPDISCEAYIEKTTFEKVIKKADVVSLHIFLNQHTRGLFHTSIFNQMKKKALIINTARGGIIKELDLLKALKTGTIGGACLDVFEEEPLAADSELRNLKQVILTPHTAGMPDGLKFHYARYRFFVENINRVIEGDEPIHSLGTGII